jgi:hypothetical protein
MSRPTVRYGEDHRISNWRLLLLGTLPVVLFSILVSARTLFAGQPLDAPQPPVQLSMSSAPQGCVASWHVVSSPNSGSSDNELREVAAISATDIWAVGYYFDANSHYQTLTEHWNGTSWTIIPSPNAPNSSDNNLYGVSAVSSTEVWAVGVYYNTSGTGQTLVERWNGSVWSIVPSPNVAGSDNELRAVYARASNDVWAVGNYYDQNGTSHTLIEHWNGSAWSITSSPNFGGEDNALTDVTAVAANDAWAVGYYYGATFIGRTLILHWNGSAWTIFSSPNVGASDNSLNGVTALAANDIWAVGDYFDNGIDRSLIEHWDGTQWSVVASPNATANDNILRDVSAVSASDIWAVGAYFDTGPVERALIEHWNGTTWSVVPSDNVVPGDNVLRGVAALSPAIVWAVGDYVDQSGVSLTLIEQYSVACVSTATASPITTPAPSSTSAPSNTPGGPTNTVAPTSTVVPSSTSAPSSTPGGPTNTPRPTNTPPGPTNTPSPTRTPGGPTDTPVPPSATATTCALEFSDVPPDSTFYSFIRCLACRGVLGGYSDSTFRPFNNITRGQIAKVVSNAAGFDEDPGPQIFEDVPADSTFYVWINRLSQRGHMGGYQCGLVPEEPCVEPDNRPYFRPNANATRGQLAKIVANAAGLDTTPTGVFYTDVPEDHPFYTWIMRLTQLGVMSGYDCGGEGEPCDNENRPYFRPFNNVTRGQAAKIVANTFFPGCTTPQK